MGHIKCLLSKKDSFESASLHFLTLRLYFFHYCFVKRTNKDLFYYLTHIEGVLPLKISDFKDRAYCVISNRNVFEKLLKGLNFRC